MEPSFKKLRWIGLLPEEAVNQRPKETAFWKRFKRSKIFEQRGPVVSLKFLQNNNNDLLIGSSLRVSLRDGSLISKYENEKSVCELDDNVQCLAIRSDGRMFAVGTSKGDILIIDSEKKLVLRTLIGHKAAVKSICFLPNKTHIISTADDRSVRMWEIATSLECWCNYESKDFVRCSSVGDDLVAVGSYDHTVRIWDLNGIFANEQPLFSLDHGCPVESVTVFPDNSVVASAGMKTIKLWRIENGQCQLWKEIIVHHKTISSLMVSPDGKYLISSSLDHSIKIIRLEDFKLAHQFRFTSAVLSFAISSDVKRVAVGLSNGKIVITSFNSETSEQTLGTIKSITSSRSTINHKNLLAEESFVLAKDQLPTLKTFDRCLKQFRYKKALDIVLQRKSGQLLASAIGELIRRDGLQVALSGRSETEIVLIINLISKNLSNPRLTSYLIDAALMVVDIFAAVAGESRTLYDALKDLRKTIDSQINIQRMLMQLEGSLLLIQSSSEHMNNK